MIELTLNQYVRESVELIRNKQADAYLDFEGIRYLIDLEQTPLGMIGFIPYYIENEEALGWKEQYRYGMQSTWGIAILGPGPRTRIEVPNPPPYPESYVTPADPGQVIPRM